MWVCVRERSGHWADWTEGRLNCLNHTSIRSEMAECRRVDDQALAVRLYKKKCRTTWIRQTVRTTHDRHNNHPNFSPCRRQKRKTHTQIHIGFISVHASTPLIDHNRSTPVFDSQHAVQRLIRRNSTCRRRRII